MAKKKKPDETGKQLLKIFLGGPFCLAVMAIIFVASCNVMAQSACWAGKKAAVGVTRQVHRLAQ